MRFPQVSFLLTNVLSPRSGIPPPRTRQRARPPSKPCAQAHHSAQLVRPSVVRERVIVPASKHTADGANGASDERTKAGEDASKGKAAQQALARKRTARPSSSAPRSSGNGSAAEDAPNGKAAQQALARKRTARPSSSAPRSSGNGSSSHASKDTADAANGASADASRVEASDDT